MGKLTLKTLAYSTSVPRHRGVYVMDDEERAAVEEALEQARRGEFVSDDEMDAFWKRLGVPCRRNPPL
jgi:hypothetical protein